MSNFIDIGFIIYIIVLLIKTMTLISENKMDLNLPIKIAITKGGATWPKHC